MFNDDQTINWSQSIMSKSNDYLFNKKGKGKTNTTILKVNENLFSLICSMMISEMNHS